MPLHRRLVREAWGNDEQGHRCGYVVRELSYMTNFVIRMTFTVGGLGLFIALVLRIPDDSEHSWLWTVLSVFAWLAVTFLGMWATAYAMISWPLRALRRERSQWTAPGEHHKWVKLSGTARKLPNDAQVLSDDERVLLFVRCRLETGMQYGYQEEHHNVGRFAIDNDDGRWRVDGQYLQMKFRSVRSQDHEVRDGDQVEVRGMLRERFAGAAPTAQGTSAAVYRHAPELEIYGTRERPALVIHRSR